jgi:hypothetical protein
VIAPRDRSAFLEPGDARPGSPAAAAPAGSSGQAFVLYLLSFVPTYVRWELGELARRGVPVRVVVPGTWPRAAMWDRIGGLPAGVNGRLGLRVADFHSWLSRGSWSVAPAAASVLARATARQGPAVVPLAGRSLREGTFRHFLAAAWLAEQLRGTPVARVHVHFARDAADVGLLLARLLGVPSALGACNACWSDHPGSSPFPSSTGDTWGTSSARTSPHAFT